MMQERLGGRRQMTTVSYGENHPLEFGCTVQLQRSIGNAIKTLVVGELYGGDLAYLLAWSWRLPPRARVIEFASNRQR